MFRRTLLASAGAIVLTGSAAFAADLPSRAPPPVYLPPPPPPLWTGLYAGINAGYTWSNSNTVDVLTTTTFNNPASSALGLTYGTAAALGSTGSLPAKTRGFIGGGQIGYNYQFANSFVVGIEADIQGIAGAKGSASAFNVTPRTPFFPPNTVATSLFVSRSINYLGTVRGRLGFLVTPTLLAYGTGGVAYGGVQSSTSVSGAEVPNTGSTGFAGTGSLSNSRVGWTAGGGLEWLFAPNWSVKAEYLYYDLGRASFSLSPLTAFATGTTTVRFTNASQSSTRFNGNIVRAGLNYHFILGAPAPVVAKY